MAITSATLPGPSPSIGVGTWAWGNRFLWGYDTGEDGMLRDSFLAAISGGLRFFDTADSYGTGRLVGRSETLLGNFCAGTPIEVRSQIQVATKLAPFPWRLGRRGLERAFVASLDRLGGKLERVQLHWSTARYAPWQELPLLDGLADLVLDGRVAEVGVSNMGPMRLRRVHAHLLDRGVPLKSLQIQMSLLAPEAAQPGGVAQVCDDLGIEMIAYSPLALGVLARPAGALPMLPRGPRRWLFRRLWKGAQPLLEAMAPMAADRDASLAAVALNWCRAHGAMPIPGLRRPEQAVDAVAASGWSLTGREVERLDALACENRARMPANPFQSV